MTSTSRPDAARSEAIRSMLIDTVDRSEARRPARRALLFTSLATAAVLVIGGLGVTISRITAPAPGHGVVVGPSPEPTLPATVTPSPGSTSGPGIVDPAGTPSPVPIVPDPAPTPAVDLSDPGSWKITFDGIGPIRVGTEPAPQESALAAFPVGDDGTGNGCGVKSWRIGDKGYFGLTKDETGPLLGSVEVAIIVDYMKTVGTPAQYAELPKTESGIGIGSTLTEVKAAYPTLASLGIGVEGTDYQVTDSRGHMLVFDIGAAESVVSINAASSRATFGLSQSCG